MPWDRSGVFFFQKLSYTGTPRQKGVQFCRRWGLVEIAHLIQEEPQIRTRLKVIDLGRLHQRVDDSAGIGALGRVGKQSVLSPYHKWTDRVLRKVVGDIHLAML